MIFLNQKMFLALKQLEIPVHRLIMMCSERLGVEMMINTSGNNISTTSTIARYHPCFKSIQTMRYMHR